MNITYGHNNSEEADYTLNSILDIIVEGVWDWKSTTGHVDRSQGWYLMLGYDYDVFKKNVFTWESVIHPDDYNRVMNHFEQYIRGEIDCYCIEYRCKKADGQYLWIIDRGRMIEHNADGTVARMIGAHQDIHRQKSAQNELIKQNKLLQDGNISLEKIVSKKTEELKNKNSELEEKIYQLEYLSNIDPLTAIANRKKFEEELSKEVLRSNRYNHPLSLAIFDIDFFKHINDTYGHKVGDSVLQNISKLVSANIREIDVFARWGGEEFVIIFPGLPLQKAFSANEKLRILISQNEIKPELFISCSFGLTEYSKSDNLEDIFHRADKALYTAKQQGRNRVDVEIKQLTNKQRETG
jgi:diguanylate cyclase (GGDEF)-like protein/PAS domain S-box-containing protein